MPRDGSNIYTRPPGTDGVPDTTIESAKYNALVADIEADLNIPRPIIAGGTASSTPRDAMIALKGEVTGQVVDNYDTFPFVSGTFHSAITATAPPVAAHGFVGICYAADNLNMVVEARDETDAAVPGLLYVREKKSGTWGPWTSQSAALDAAKVNRAGDTMTGPLKLSGEPTDPVHAVTKTYVDAGDALRLPKTGGIMTGPIGMDAEQPVVFGAEGHLIRRAADGRLLIGGAPGEVEIVTSLLKLAGPPTTDLHAATKKYADDKVTAGSADKLPLTGGTMTGPLTTAPSPGALTQVTPSPAIVVKGSGNTAGQDAFMSFMRGAVGVNFGLGADNRLKVGGFSMGEISYELSYVDQEDQVITGGASVVPKALSALSGATIVIDPGDRPMMTISNNGLGTIQPGAIGGQCTLLVTNMSGAAIPLTSAWTKVDGTFDDIPGSKFLCSCAIFPGAASVLSVVKIL